MNQLLARVQKIEDECAPSKNKNKKGGQEDDENMDEFTRLRKKIGAEIRNVRSV
jgi:hypothetical protein